MISTQVSKIKSTKVDVNGSDPDDPYAVVRFYHDGQSDVSVMFDTPGEMQSLAHKLMDGAKTLSQMQAEDKA